MIQWDFLQKFPKLEADFAILILNQFIQCNPLHIKSLWTKGAIRALVDGGSNRWLHFLQEHKISNLELPDFLSGDFDSIKPETRAYFESRDVNIINTPDQNETDFTKALRCVADQLKAKNLNIKSVLAVCENSGRFDQVISNINTLHLASKIFKDIPVIILSSQSITWLLPPGEHNIFVKEEFVIEKYSCGLIPFCGPTSATTRGLKWNLENQTMEFGGLISTSNTYSAEEVYISCERPLVWTTEYCKIN